MKFIATDLDDTILQFSDAMQAFLVAKGFVIETRLRDYHNIPKLFNLDIPSTIELIREFHRSPAMARLLPEPCAAIVLPELHRQGYQFVAVSACLNEPDVHAMRVRNLEEVFGFQFEAVHCIGLTMDKEATLRAYPASIWVEDVWHHALAGNRVGHRTFLLDRPYNRDHVHPEVTRVHDWHQIAQLIA
jgi:5'(3')-deoxyribonucleotidase